MSAQPSVQITMTPPFAEGSPAKLETIEGRAPDARRGQRVVLYARSGVWWIQPEATRPFTEIQPGFRWKNVTHPGTAYAALLVAPDYNPPRTADVLPSSGDSVIAVDKVEGPPLPPRRGRMLMFDGYEWQVRDTPGDPGGTPNNYDPANAWTDVRGFLHLRISGTSSHWTSAEVNLNRSLGYGSYRFVVRDVSRLNPSTVFSMLTWDDAGADQEMDIEVSRWGQPSGMNAQFVVQPYYLPANTIRFEAPRGTVTFMLRWDPDRAEFKAFAGAVSRWNAPAAGSHSFTSGVPRAATEAVHLNLYVFGGGPLPEQLNNEVIVEKFEYLP